MKLAMGLISGEDAQKWVEEHADDGGLGKGALQSAESTLPKEYALYANYPNPFNPVTHIAYDLPEVAAVRMEIYNVLGQRTAVLLDAKQTAGHHEILWDGLSSAGTRAGVGLYFCRMTAGKFSKTIKMTLLP